MTVLTKIRERFAGRQADAETRYAGFVSDSAAGRDVDDVALTSVMNITGRTMEQFIADVERIERRAGVKLKLAEVEKLRPACEAACLETSKAMSAVNDAREKAQKLIGDAIRNSDEKSAISRSLQRQIRELEMTAGDDLRETADPSLQAEIDQLEARCRDIRMEQNSVGRSPGCDSAEAMMQHHKCNAETARLQEQIEKLQLQQVV